MTWVHWLLVLWGVVFVAEVLCLMTDSEGIGCTVAATGFVTSLALLVCGWVAAAHGIWSYGWGGGGCTILGIIGVIASIVCGILSSMDGAGGSGAS